jgi:hypothetical protein
MDGGRLARILGKYQDGVNRYLSFFITFVLLWVHVDFAKEVE